MADQPPGHRDNGDHQHQQIEQRRTNRGDHFGHMRADKGRQRDNEQQHRNIDKPRPVHRQPLGRSYPPLGQVKPALPADKIANLLKPQKIIGVVKILGDRHLPEHVNQEQRHRCPEQQNGFPRKLPRPHHANTIVRRNR